MLARIQRWRKDLTLRERRLVDFAVAITAVVVLVYGVVLPLGAAFDSAAARHTDAVRRSARLEAEIEALRRPGLHRRAAPGSLEEAVSRSLQTAGLAVQTLENQGGGRVHVVITTGAAGAVLPWLDRLGEDGLVIERASLRPAPDGSVIADLLVRRP